MKMIATSDTTAGLRHLFFFFLMLFLVPGWLLAQSGGLALDFDGKGGIIEINDSPELSGGAGKSKTVEAWVKLDNLLKDRPVVQKWKDRAFKEWGLMVDGSGGHEVSVAIENNGSNFEYKAGGGIISANVWHHIAFTYEDATQIVRVYIDGVEYGSGAVVPVGMPDTNTKVLIGIHAYDDKKFLGQIDEIRVWDFAKSGSELRSLMNRTLTGNESGLVAYWTFDEGAPTVTDHSGEKNHGSVVPGPNGDPFFVTSTTPFFGGDYVYLSSPRGGEVLETGSSYTVRWTSSGAGADVAIEFSDNNGASWSTLAASTTNDGSFNWTVPVDTTSDGLIRITSTSNGSLSDVSVLTFSITPPGGSQPPPEDEGSCLPVNTGYRDFFYGVNSVTTKPTEDKPESKLWFNDGIWWGVMWDPNDAIYRIYRFDAGTQCWSSVGPNVDERPESAQDCLWDGSKLYVASRAKLSHDTATGPKNARLYRYSYNPGTKTYTLDSGFPVTFNDEKTETLVLVKDSTGQLWATWTKSGKVWINRTLGNDLTWGNPFLLPVQGGDADSDDISAMIAFDGNKIGVMWSNQVDKKGYFAVHRDSNSDLDWEPREVAVSEGNENVFDDHINLAERPSTGELVAAIKTNMDGTNKPLIYLLKRRTNGAWEKFVVAVGSDHLTRPMVLVDSETDSIYVFASRFTSPRRIELKVTHFDNPSFATGPGRVFIYGENDTAINNVKSTKQNVNSATGILGIASDHSTRYYLHNYLSLGGHGVNQPPVANNDAAFTQPNTSVNINVTANDTDVDGFIDHSSVAIVGQPSNGTAVVSGPGAVSYTPNAGFEGSDSFAYRVNDNEGAASNIATVSVTVSSGGGSATLTFQPTDDVQVKAGSPNSNYDFKSTAKVQRNAFNAYFKFNVAGIAGVVMSAKLKLYVTDSSDDGGTVHLVSNNYDGSSSFWVEEQLTWNNAPAINSPALDGLGTINVDTFVEFDVTAAVSQDGTYSFAIQSNSSDFAQYNVREGSNPPELIVVTANSGPQNSPPVAQNDQTVTDEGVAVVIDILANDSDADGTLEPSTVQIVVNPINGAVTLNAGSGVATYTPDAGFSGADSFSYTVNDNDGATSNTALVSITVNSSGGSNVSTFLPTDDGQVKLTEPTRNYGAKTTTKVKADKFNSYFKFNVTGLTGAVLSAKIRFKVTDGAFDGSDSGGSIHSVDNSFSGSSTPWVESSLTSGNAPVITSPALSSLGAVSTNDLVEFDVTAAISGNGVYSFAINSASGNQVKYYAREGAIPPQLIIQTGAAGGNIPPVAVDDVATTSKDTPVAIDVLANDSDSDGTLVPSTVSILNQPGKGTVAVNSSSGVVTYTPNNGFVGIDSFRYNVEDNEGDSSNIATVAITVVSGNVPPVAADDAASTTEDTPVTIDVLSNDSDSDGTLVPGSVTVVTPPSNGSTVIAAGTGAVTYTPSSGFVGSDSFEYTVEDNDGAASNNATATIIVNAASGTSTLTFSPTDDGQVKLTAPGNNYGAKTTMKVEEGKFSSYMKFNIAGVSGTVQNARVRLRVTNNAFDGSDQGGSIYSVSNNFAGTSTSWNEGSLNAGNAPAMSGSPLSILGPVAVNEFVEFDVTNAINGDGTYSFGIKSTSANQVKYYTGQGANPPELIVAFGSGSGGNIPPVAQDDQATTSKNLSVVLNLLANDSDPDGSIDATTLSITSPPSNGTTSVNVFSGIVTYVPDPDFTGSDSFLYTVQDNEGATSNVATVTVNVTGGGGISTLTFQPTDDGQVKLTEPASNYGSKSTTKVEAQKFSTYLKFSVAGVAGSVQQAILRLRVSTDASNGGPDGGSIYLVDNDFSGTNTVWVEASLTSGNAPEITGSSLSSLGSVSPGEVVEFDVTSAVNGDGVYSFAIRGNSTNQVKYYTREGATPPELIVEFTTTAGTSKEEIAGLLLEADSDGEIPALLPEQFVLSPNYPNPFNAETRIEYAVPEAAKIAVIIYNTRGQEVVTLVDEVQQPGFKKVVWYGTDNFGNFVSSGVYFLRLRAGGQNLMRKLTLQK